QVRARRAQAVRSADDAQIRVERLKQQIADVTREAEGVARALAADDTLNRQREALLAAQAAAGEAEQAAVAAEVATQQAQAAVDAARPALQELERQLSGLEAEAQTLDRMLKRGGASLWPAIVD